MPDVIAPRRALLSVSDKTGLIEFGRFLATRGVEILSTGGTAKALRDAGVPVKDVSDHTGFPEILDGRVKTLVPQVHGGILGRRDLAEHLAQMEAHGIAPIDLVAVNLYPFEATVAKGADFDDCIENIDIGGPAMIRSAAKNHAHVAVLTEPAHFAEVQAEIAEAGGTRLATRRRLAAAAYARTAAYDAAISGWFAGQDGQAFPERLSAFEALAEFADPAIVIVKHANPCGVAVAGDLAQAWDRALMCDPVSAFGGIVAANRKLDAAAAERITAIFTEVVIAPDADEAALAIFAKKKNLRLLLTGGLPDPAAPGMVFRSVAGGFLAQSRDAGRVSEATLKCVTKRAPTATEMADLLFAFRVCKHVKSNAIVYAKNLATVGIGAGQMNRAESSRIAAWKSEAAAKAAGLPEPLAKGSVVASDAFFPFADGLEIAASAGATAIIQPGGSIRDNEVIEAADKAGLAMVFTGMRHFRH